MRLFVGIAVEQIVLDEAVQLWIAASGMRATLGQNLHITLKFIGAWPDARLTEITEALGTVPGAAMEIRLGGLGLFPEKGTAKTLWVGADGGNAMVDLAARIDARLARLGVPAETRPYRPHVTLARAGRNATPDRRHFSDLPLLHHLRTCVATDFHLYESMSQQGSSVYRRLATFALQKPVH